MVNSLLVDIYIYCPNLISPLAIALLSHSAIACPTVSELEPEKVTVFDVEEVFAPLPTVSLTSTLLENPALGDEVETEGDDDETDLLESRMPG